MEPKALKCSRKNIIKNHERNLNTRTHNFKQEPLECVPGNKKKKILQNQGEQACQHCSTKEMKVGTHIKVVNFDTTCDLENSFFVDRRRIN